MANYLWTKDLSIGVTKIDHQHQQLFDTLNKLQDAMKSGSGKKEVANTVDFLAEYTKTHFREEEEIMQKNNYPDYVAHKRIHEHFLKTVENHKKQVQDGDVNLSLVVKLYQELGDWLTKHIGLVDKKLGEFLSSK